MFLWGGATSSFGFWTALFASAYFIIGTKFEERKLVRLYGDAYRQYQESVSMYFPWKRMS
jgi:protein-S-isoprenylcysteine O-methyltransferase Ste14